MNDDLKTSEALTPAETRARAREYRLLAATATTAQVQDALLRMARMLERRAAEKDAQDANRVHGERGAFVAVTEIYDRAGPRGYRATIGQSVL